MGLLVFGLGQIGLGRTRLGGQAPLAPAPPSWFNDCLLWFAHSFAHFKESLSGSVHSAQRWPSLPQLKQWPHRSASSDMAITAM